MKKLYCVIYSKYENKISYLLVKKLVLSKKYDIKCKYKDEKKINE